MNLELIDIRTVRTEGMGSLSFLEAERDVPFEINRIYYIYEASEGVHRGGHAHRKLSQLLVCVYGAIEVVLDDGRERKSVFLDDPSKGLIVRNTVWREMKWHRNGSVLAVAASDYYDEGDYIRSYGEFLSELEMDSGPLE